jgi:undecaprenyl-diphosphatase
VEALINCPSSYSLPSGHSLSSFLAASLLFAYDKRSGSWAYFLALLVGLSRIYLGVHYFTDVLAGAGLGVLIAWLIIRIKKAYEKV